jgi:hypothetical protein
MGIEKFIKKISVQTAVYWGNPENDGSGGFVFDEPVEIKCRWEDKTQVVNSSDGSEVVSDSFILTNEDLDENGYLFLGTLDDLDSDELTDPKSKTGARMILSKNKIPMIKSTKEFVRLYYLKRKNQ